MGCPAARGTGTAPVAPPLPAAECAPAAPEAGAGRRREPAVENPGRQGAAAESLRSGGPQARPAAPPTEPAAARWGRWSELQHRLWRRDQAPAASPDGRPSVAGPHAARATSAAAASVSLAGAPRYADE